MTSPPPSPNRQELTRLTAPGTQEAKTGIQKLPMAARIPLTVLDAVGSTFLPGLMMGLPGTQLHHNLMVRGAERNVGDEQAAQSAKSKQELESAQTENLRSEAQHREQTPPGKTEAEQLEYDKEGNAIGYRDAAGQLHPKDEPGAPGRITNLLSSAKTKPPTPEKADLHSMLAEAVADAQKRGVKAHDDPKVQEILGTMQEEGRQPAPKEPGREDKAVAIYAKNPKDRTPEESAFIKGYEKDVDVTRTQPGVMRMETPRNPNDLVTRQAALKAYTPASDSAERFNVMSKNYEDALRGDQQAMVSLLANHIGMTMGLQKGAKITQFLYSEAEHSAPWLQNVKKRFDKEGYLQGVTLSPEQMKQMLSLARERFGQDVSKARNEAHYLGINDEGPERIPTEQTIRHYGALAGGDVTKAKALAAADGWSVK
jgi:hypothetical protein